MIVREILARQIAIKSISKNSINKMNLPLPAFFFPWIIHKINSTDVENDQIRKSPARLVELLTFSIKFQGNVLGCKEPSSVVVQFNLNSIYFFSHDLASGFVLFLTKKLMYKLDEAQCTETSFMGKWS